MIFRTAVICAAWLGVTAAAADAATVTITPVEPQGESPSSGDIVRFAAAPGERNAVSAQFDWDPGGGTWTITDTGAALVAVIPCRAADPHTVTCTAAEDRYIDRAEFDLGDLDDDFRASSPTTDPIGTLRADGGAGDDALTAGSDVNILRGGAGDDTLVGAGLGAEINALDGGPDDDRLIGGPSGDTLDGGGGRDEIYGGDGDDLMSDGDREGAPGEMGPGPDLFDGGSDGCCLILRGDRVSYRGRKAPIVADLSTGATAEGDVLRGVESIEGGSGDDQLLGDDRGNALMGRTGRDRLEGRGGRDTLVPGRGGGPIACGGGIDVVQPSSSEDLLDGECERVDPPALFVYGLRAHPRVVGPRDLRFRAGCPENGDDDVEASEVRCSGEVELRTAGAGGRVLARGGFPPGRWDRRSVALRLTRAGRRLAARPGGVRAVVRFVLRYRVRDSGRVTDAARWSITLTTGRPG